jgi:hypothetical protein
MGLDQYLTGRKFMSFSAPERTEDGFPIEEIKVKLGYWRKHPNLHGYIIDHFGPKTESGEPIDDCRDIEMTVDALQQTIDAVKANDLPHTEGFFFGESAGEDDDYFQQEKEETLRQLAAGLMWMLKEAETGGKYWYSVYYTASW